MRYLWHATQYIPQITASIMDKGLLTKYNELYFAETEEDAVKFVMFRGYPEILVCKVKVLKEDEKYIKESFDHNQRIFNARAFVSSKPFGPEKIVEYRKWDNPLFKRP